MQSIRLAVLCGIVIVGSVALGGGLRSPAAKPARQPGWRHLSTATSDLEAPNTGGQQTSSLVFDIDRDGMNDFVITERTAAPAVVWYRRTAAGWDRYLVDPGALHIEAGSACFDIDGDGDLDFSAGGDFASNRVWWWENPYPDLEPGKAWKRHEIKNSGSPKHHDQLYGDFDGDGLAELAFWNQGALALYLAEIPTNPREAKSWEYREIYRWTEDGQMEQRGSYPAWKAIDEHEGLAKADIDSDGQVDIVGGGRWFKHMGGGQYSVNLIDAGYSFSRAAAGQLIEGGRPEVVLVVGDGLGPLVLYEWQKGTWVGTILIPEVESGHTLALTDFESDGDLDIFSAEMRLDGGNPDARIRLLLGDGRGHFEETVIDSGYGLHESAIADLDGDGDADILGKPYNWETPRLDIWLNPRRH